MEDNNSSATAWVIGIIVVVIIIILAWYLLASGPATSAVTPTPTPITQTAAPATVPTALAVPVSSAALLNAVTGNTLGDYLTALNGMTLYHYTKDAPGVSTCTGTCAVSWPPFVIMANTSLTAGNGVTGKLSTITRADGTKQLTYNNAPLYFWSGDAKSGDTMGNGIGGVWFVVKP